MPGEDKSLRRNAVQEEPASPPDNVWRQIKNSAPLQLGIVAIVAALFFAGMTIWARIDGGIGELLAELYGAVGAVVIGVGASARILSVQLQRKRRDVRFRRDG
jgi:hypothetical protein